MISPQSDRVRGALVGAVTVACGMRAARCPSAQAGLPARTPSGRPRATMLDRWCPTTRPAGSRLGCLGVAPRPGHARPPIRASRARLSRVDRADRVDPAADCWRCNGGPATPRPGRSSADGPRHRVPSGSTGVHGAAAGFAAGRADTRPRGHAGRRPPLEQAADGFTQATPGALDQAWGIMNSRAVLDLLPLLAGMKCQGVSGRGSRPAPSRAAVRGCSTPSTRWT